MAESVTEPTARDLLEDPVLHLLLEQDAGVYEGRRNPVERLREQRLKEAGFEAV